MFAVPNGGSRNKIEAANLKRQGVKAGVPDIFLPLPRNGFHGLFIEMKTKGNKCSEAQNGYIAEMALQGYKVAVCYGADEAINEIKSYLGG